MRTIINPSQTPRFDDELFRRFGRKARTTACAILEGLELPLPKTRDYFWGKESLQVFLQQQGLVLRFGQPSLARISDYTLQPLQKIALDDTADFELMPGIQVGGSAFDKIRLKALLALRGESFPRKEMTRSNIGYIKTSHGCDHKLILDRCAVVPLLRTFNSASGAMVERNEAAPVQAAYFREIKAHVQQAFSGSALTIRRVEKDTLFKLCEDHAALPEDAPGKRLFNDWVMPGLERPRHTRIKTAAQEYALRR